MRRAHAFALFAVFSATALVVVWPSLGYYWNWDDLHLVRPYTSRELVATLTGQWALSAYETLGLRPVTTLFNHARWMVFGEHLVAHRLFLVTLFAGYLTRLAHLLCRLGGHWVAGLLAGVIALCAKNSYYHIVWIADGIHLLQALLVVTAPHLVLSGVENRGAVAWVGAWSLLTLALLAREDSLVGFPFVLVVGAFHAWRRSEFPAAARSLLRLALALSVAWIAVWVWRLLAVPNAPQFKFAADSLVRLWNMAQWTIGLAGQRDGSAPVFVLLFVGAVAVASVLGPQERRLAWLWLFLTAVAVTPGNVRAVPNLLVFAIGCYAIFLGIVLRAIGRRSPFRLVVVMVLVGFSTIVSARASRLEQISLHPLSADQMRRDWMFIYGPFRDAVIPEARVRVLREKLDRYGVDTADFDFERWYTGLAARGLGHPEAGQPFVPPRPFLRP